MVVDFVALGERTIYLDCDVLQAEGGTRCASITGAYVALALACARLRAEGRLERSPLNGSVAAVSCGIIDGVALLDLDYSEDSTAEVDANVVMTGEGGLVEVQATAERTPLSRAHLDELLALADEHTRECLGGLVERNITGRHLIDELDRLAVGRGYPAVLRCDNGPELACAAMADWAGERVGLHFIPPGQPWRNARADRRWSPHATHRSPRSRRTTSAREKAGLQRRYLVIDLRSVVQVVLVLAGGREEELDAVAAHAVVAREQGRASDGSDFTFRIVAGPHADPDLHDVSRVAPHRRVVRVVHEVVLNRHDDRAGPILLADDPRDRVGFEVDFAMALGEAARPRVRARMKAPWGNPVNGRYLRAGRGSAGRAGHAAQCQQRQQRQECESAAPRDVVPPHSEPIIASAARIAVDESSLIRRSSLRTDAQS